MERHEAILVKTLPNVAYREDGKVMITQTEAANCVITSFNMVIEFLAGNYSICAE